MTAFASSDLPSSVNSLEKLVVWSQMVLNHLYPNMTAIEAPNTAIRVATSGLFYIVDSDPATWRHVGRNSIKLDSNFQRGAAKIWTFANDLGSTAIPTEFKS
ncbi:hypothetical protein L3556_00875 [Candidatus Synechococcus calcipolaris G9]|uniref:Uncharacterized protein n=1 Tax=Candidatus Synechococcus calcipolaris G9 TaxID=1497997 RepID=A0ABT6EUC8_9SYNE|nr:hypothetical protein [Candidatus Synechococcus calcipolaris]MDG2989491.1 hypothetical protein [Candidatus Synechococcus calcipolaris G9]